jgi:hypothetical protein
MAGIFGALFMAAAGFAIAIYGDFAHFSNDKEEVVAEAADDAKLEQAESDGAEIIELVKGKPAENLKTPLTYAHFKAPAQFAGIEFNYPLTWSVYEKNDATKTTDDKRYDIYFDVGTVDSTQTARAHSLVVSIISDSYESVLGGFRKNIDSGILMAVPYAVTGHENDVNYSGVLLDGNLETGVTGVMLILKTREKTLTIRSDLADTMDDFRDIMLPSFTFVP